MTTIARFRIPGVAVLLLLLLAPAAQAQSGLNFFKNWFVTGDYVVGGVGLKAKGTGGLASGTINVSGVPANSVILGAFLYWETIAANVDAGHLGATFKGNVLSSSTQPNLAHVLTPDGTTACWTGGGAPKVFAYRADVLRFLEQDPVSGRLIANGAHTVKLPDSGNANALPSTAGATLVIIYRDPTKGLRGISVYDGALTLNANVPRIDVPIQGWYQSQIPTPSAKLTPIAGGGKSTSLQRVFLDNTLVATNPFKGTAGASWDNPTIQVTTKFPGNVGSTVVSVQRDAATDCHTFTTFIFTTSVQDNDRDGIVDILETSGTNVTDPLGRQMPNLAAMGASPMKKDLFVEVGFMSSAGYTNPIQGQVVAHDHKPSLASLEMVYQAFLNAPISNPDGTTGIRLHFDVGDNYQSPAPPPFIVPAAYARGGESIDETACTAPWDHDGDPNTPPLPCQFPDFPGTVAWKNAYRFYRDQPLNYQFEQQCVAAGLLCERRFDQVRKPIFHYVLYAHALGLPKSDDPNSPDFHIPRNVSGIADPPGGDLMVTLGLWGSALTLYKGDDFTQATTLMHELGHNLGLKHGGQPSLGPNGVPVPEPNCKSNFLSVMNYLFQMPGLKCVAGTTAPECVGRTGASIIDYSRGPVPGLNENALSETNPGLGTLLYPTRWWAPKSGTLVGQFVNQTASTRRCNGSPAAPGEAFITIDGTALTGGLDWNGNGTITGVLAQDINYSGPVSGQSALTPLNASTSDWFFVDLRQVAARRNVGSQRVGGAFSLDIDWPDLGFGDTGFGDTGFGDTGFGDTGFGDTGFGDTGFGDTGFGDTGFGDTGFGDTGAPLGDLDFDTATAVPPTPEEVKSGAAPTPQSVTLSWDPPHLLTAVTYEVLRILGTTVTPGTDIARLATIPAPQGTVTFVDTTVRRGTTYTYFVIATYDNGSTSGPSNFFTITTPLVQ